MKRIFYNLNLINILGRILFLSLIIVSFSCGVYNKIYYNGNIKENVNNGIILDYRWTLFSDDKIINLFPLYYYNGQKKNYEFGVIIRGDSLAKVQKIEIQHLIIKNRNTTVFESRKKRDFEVRYPFSFNQYHLPDEYECFTGPEILIRKRIYRNLDFQCEYVLYFKDGRITKHTFENKLKKHFKFIVLPIFLIFFVH